MLVLIAFTLALALGLAGFYVYRRMMEPQRRIAQRISPARVDLSFAPGEILRSSRSRVPFARFFPLSGEAQERLATELALAGRPLRPSEYIGLRAIAATGGVVAGALLGALFGGNVWLIVGLAGVLGTTGWMLPHLQLRRAQAQRAKRIEAQIPDALMAVAKSLRAGSGLIQALANAAEETGDPLGSELRTTLRDLELGGDSEEVFADLSRRVGSPDLDIAVTAIIIQRTVGGNLSEILLNVVRTVRERLKLKKDIDVITSRQKLMGNLVAIIPVAIAGLFMLINPDIGERLFTENIGRIALAVGIGFELLGLVLIRRLAVVEV